LQLKGIISSLQQGFEDIKEGDGGFYMRTVSGEKVWCDTRFHDGQHLKLADISVDVALTNWFRYWAHEHRYEDQGISIEKGGIIPRRPFSRNLRVLKKEEKGEPSKGDAQSQVLQLDKDGQPIPLPEGTVAGASDVSDELKPMDGDESLEQETQADKDVDLTMRLGETHQEPSAWQRNPLLIQDPFIRAKNAAGGITDTVLKRFKSECARSLMVLEGGGSLDMIIGKGDPVGGPRPDRRPKGGQAQKKKSHPGRGAEGKGKQAEGKGKGKGAEGKRKEEVVAGTSTKDIKIAEVGSRGNPKNDSAREGDGKNMERGGVGGPGRRGGKANPPVKPGSENRRRRWNPKVPAMGSENTGNQGDLVGAMDRRPAPNDTRAD